MRGKYQPSFNPLPPPLLSLAKAAATDAQQKQHSWSACKRKGDIAREGRGGAGAWGPLLPALGAPLAPRRAPALAMRPSPAGAQGGPEPAAGRAHASRRAHSMVRCGRGGCGRRAFSPPPRSAALQVRRQVGAAAAHITGRARWGLPASGRLRARPAAGADCGAAACGSPRGSGSWPGRGWRAPPSANGRGTLSVPARALARQSVRLSGSVQASEAPRESSASWLPQRAGAERPPLHRTVIGDQQLLGPSEPPGWCKGVGFPAPAPREGAKGEGRLGERQGEGGTHRREREWSALGQA